MNYHKKLATQIYNLLNTLCLRFPHDKNLALCLTGIETLKNHNLRKISNFYISKIYLRKTKTGQSFSKLIDARDSSFFLSNVLVDEIPLPNIELDPIIDTLRIHWVELSEEEQNNIWIYFDVLNKLTERHLTEEIKLNLT
jgi:hypothetical protein